MPAGCVKAGLVAFIELESDEACMEMRIGLGRVKKLLDGGDVEVAWWDMCGTGGRKAWPANPTFKPWKLRGRVGTSTEPKRCILPVPLYLTGTQGLPDKGRSIAGSSLKLTKRCVTVLRKYCLHVRPDLRVACRDSDGGCGAGDDDAVREDGGEEEKGEEESEEVGGDLAPQNCQFFC
jgi:hypothetical protein